MTGLLVNQISAQTCISRADVKTIIETAPQRYKTYCIAKRNGGERLIAHPSRELKAIQRALVALAPAKIPLHNCASAYELGCSIKKNAQAHVKSKWLAKFDLENFFNSIRVSDWSRYLNNLKIEEEFVHLSTSAFFWSSRRANENCLSVGAPSSPYVSNRIMFRFDESMYLVAKENGWIYTRYADDLSFSSDQPLDMALLIKMISEALRIDGNLKLNEAKTRLLGPGSRRTVTGIVLSNDFKISLGRTKKRNIEAMLHKHIVKKNEVDKKKLNGHLAFLRDIDPSAYLKLHEKYNLPKEGIGFKIN